jgi:hypothetical protein
MTSKFYSSHLTTFDSSIVDDARRLNLHLYRLQGHQATAATDKASFKMQELWELFGLAKR